MSQQLKNVIVKEGRVFGDTNTGVDWCVKALHPSDPMTEVRGIPDQSAVPTLCMNYQSTASLTIAAGQTTPWAFDLTLLPHPLFFAYWDGVKAHDPATNVTGEGNFFNSQVGQFGTGVDVIMADWLRLAKRWRLCYQSVTVLQDGPDLANQGTLAVCQSTFEPRILNTCFTTPGDNLIAAFKTASWDQSTEGPNFERSQAMPNAMIGRSKEGCYIPLKLTDTCQQWHSETTSLIPMTYQNLQSGLPSGLVQVPGAYSPAYPFPYVQPLSGTPTTGVRGQVIPDLLNGNVAHLSARNLSDQTSFTFQFRTGIEIQLDPSSNLTPQLKLSPPHDPRALSMYFAIARELKDAYPADYNVTGKLWSAIRDALGMIAPALLTAIPGGSTLIPMVGPVLDGATIVGKAIKARRQKRKAKSRIQTGQPSQSTAMWDPTPESYEAGALRRAAEARLATELSQATKERAVLNRSPNSARPVQMPLPRRLPRRRRLFRAYQ